MTFAAFFLGVAWIVQIVVTMCISDDRRLLSDEVERRKSLETNWAKGFERMRAELEQTRRERDEYRDLQTSAALKLSRITAIVNAKGKE